MHYCLEGNLAIPPGSIFGLTLRDAISMPNICHTMEARKLLYTMLAVSPAILMAGIGIHARAYVDPFDWPSVVEDHFRTSAYIPLVVETQNLLANPSDVSRSEVPRLAAKWVDGAKSGHLRPLVATTLDENPSAGNKGKVISVNYQLARCLVKYSDSEIAAGNYHRAATNLVLASDSLNCVKYSNFLSLYRVSLAQHNILVRIRIVYSKATPQTRKILAQAMLRMNSDDESADRLTRHTARLINNEIQSFREVHLGDRPGETSQESNTLFEQPALAKSNGLASETELESIELASPNLSLEVSQCKFAAHRNRLMIQKIMSLSPHSAL